MTNQGAPRRQDGLLLPGLDGSNPLGFLAALGLLRVVSLQRHADPVRMRWEVDGATWKPRIYGGGRDIDELLNRLIVGFDACDPTPWSLDRKLPFAADKLRVAVLSATDIASVKGRDHVDTLGSFGVECMRNDKGIFKDTSLRMVRAGDSAGNGLLAYGKRIQGETTKGDLGTTLVGPWKYEDEGCALRWDPTEHHGYAMQWTDPSKEKTVSVRGANRLALAAMPMMPTIPKRTRAATAAFARPDARQECMSWPLWTVACGIDVVVSLLTLPCLQDEQPDRVKLHARGVKVAYRCDRIMTSTYYRNFTPARRVA